MGGVDLQGRFDQPKVSKIRIRAVAATFKLGSMGLDLTQYRPLKCDGFLTEEFAEQATAKSAREHIDKCYE